MPLYFIQGIRSRLVKIGFSADPEKRLKQLQTGCHEQLKLVRMFDAPQTEERGLHQALAAYRHRPGEWFDLPPDILNGDIGFPDLAIPEPRPTALFGEWQARSDREWRARRRAAKAPSP